MPKRRYQRREPTQDWQQIRPLLKDSAQITYEIIRPVILWGQTPKERGEETSMSLRTVYYKANHFGKGQRASSTICAEEPNLGTIFTSTTYKWELSQKTESLESLQKVKLSRAKLPLLRQCVLWSA